MNRTRLKEATGLSYNVIAKLGKCETISMESLLKICDALQCDISDVMEIVPSEQYKNETFAD
ncbi:MAG: helix-turn-helix transcriptional regulator [Clostridium sp.]|nr:helix-turn-helix transcriptional regulator [Clostridium sp.]